MFEYACNIGNKFNEDGSVRFFPGNTIISFIDHTAPVWQEFQKIRSMLTSRKAAHCATVMPDSSIHMTVFEGVCHGWRDPSVWTEYLPTDCTLSETDELFANAFSSVRPLGPVNMRMDHIRMGSGIGIILKPATAADAAELRRFREDCSKALGIRFKDFENYDFHMTVCYFTSAISSEDEEELLAFQQEAETYIAQRNFIFPIKQPQLTFFNNMFDFTPNRIERGGL